MRSRCTVALWSLLQLLSSSSSFQFSPRRPRIRTRRAGLSASNNNNNNRMESSSSSETTSLSIQCADRDSEGEQSSAVDDDVPATTFLDRRNPYYIIVSKPPSVVCHHSEWTGSRANIEVPMLQRARKAVGDRRVNLVHRLDRGCSGCLLMTYSDEEDKVAATAKLSEAMSSPTSQKTYVAIVRGEGIYKGRDFKKEGWFKVDRPIKNEEGVLNDASTWFRFVAGQDNASGTLDRPRASLVLARPETGRWHQIRRHLNGLSHPILGDSTHGDTRTNAIWKKNMGLLPERTCLHLSRLCIGPVPEICPDGIDISCPLAPDMMRMLLEHLPNVLVDAEPILCEEGIKLE